MILIPIALLFFIPLIIAFIAAINKAHEDAGYTEEPRVCEIEMWGTINMN